MRARGTNRLLQTLAGSLLWAGLLMGTSAQLVHAQEAPGQETKAEPSNLGTWKLINTGIFAVALGWFLVKYSPRFFNARSGDIQKAIRDATGLKIEADFRSSDIDRKMATLDDAVRKLRDEANIELDREHDRIRRETDEQISDLRENAAAQIDAWRKDGRNRVRVHTSQLALNLAEQRLRDRLAQGEPGQFTDDFVRLVERGKN